MLPVAMFAAFAATQNITVYHLNPLSAGVVPVNMDTGDALGDLYFYLGQFLLPLECANVSNHSSGSFDCNNPERRDKSLVVTEVDLTIDTNLTQYSACNLCNGTDPFTGRPCEVGSYICDCFHHHSSSNASCDGKRVGMENITEHFTHNSNDACRKALERICPLSHPVVRTDEDKCYNCTNEHYYELERDYNCSKYDFYYYCPSNDPSDCEPWNPAWPCWRENIPRKTGGLWYSTLAEGQCTGDNQGDCSWTVRRTKTVNETCLKQSLVDTVVDYSPACFHNCAQPKNESSSCFIGCFFDAILGAEARNASDVKLGGMPVAKLQEGWTRAFDGRCPLIPTA